MRLLSEKIAATWHKSNSEVMGYVRARLMFASFVLQICAFVESGEMEEKDGDRRRSRTSIHAGVTLFN